MLETHINSIGLTDVYKASKTPTRLALNYTYTQNHQEDSKDWYTRRNKTSSIQESNKMTMNMHFRGHASSRGLQWRGLRCQRP